MKSALSSWTRFLYNVGPLKPTRQSLAPHAPTFTASPEEIRKLEQKVSSLIPEGITVQLQTIYGQLSKDERTLIRRSTYANLLQLSRHLQQHSTGEKIFVSSDGLRVTKLTGDRLTLEPSVECLLNPIMKAEPVVVVDPLAHRRGDGATKSSPAPSSGMNPILPENLWELYCPPVDNFQPPEAPPLTEMSKSERRIHEKIGVGHAGVFTGEMLVPYLPVFFVPMEDVLSSLPDGYTAAHIENIFTATRTVEVVKLEGKSFVRMNGGYTIDLSQSHEANERFRKFQPDPTLVDFFIELFERPYKWRSLREVISEAPPGVVKRLPFERYKSILYFAQMQHRFCFSASGEGEICYADSETSLSPTTSPTPVAVSEVLKLLGEHGGMQLAEIVESLSVHSLRELILCFNSMKDFVAAHGEIFVYDEVNRLVETKSQVESRMRQNLTVEEKLEAALLKGEKRDVRKYRRRLAILQNPNNPLIDRDKLIEEVKKFMPKRRNIAFRALMRNLPPDIVDLFPSEQINLFRSPEHFQIFEFRTKGRLHICRAGVPLPDGHLRVHYSDDEIVHMCATSLLHQPRLMVDIFSRLPWAAREIVRTKHKGLFHLLSRYPQYFAIVFKDGKQRYDSRAASVSLVGQPPVTMHDSEWGNSDSAPLSPDDDEGAVEEVQENARSLGFVPVTAKKPQSNSDHQDEDGGNDDDEGR